jgi:glycine/D-amino acid oxidase-like deaminating enzyme
VLVIGAGYAGLSAAIAAHDCGATVAVADAGLPGAGASSRNGGMVGAHPRLSWYRLAGLYGAETADALFAEARPALEWLRGFIRSEGIDCDLQQTGRIQLAWTRKDFEAQRQMARDVAAKSDVQVRLLDRSGLGSEIATDQYFGGLLFPEHAAIDPAKFHRGLMRAAQRRGIAVAGACPVTALDRAPLGFTARTGQGRVRADKVILATNGYTGPPFRWHALRVFALPSFIIATEQLPAGDLAHLAPGRRTMVETRARHSYFRLSPDGRRVLFGGRAAMRPVPLERAAERLHATMAGIWPELRGVKLSHVWMGNVGYTFDHMPNVGEDRGLHHAMGFSGSGTVMAPYLGAKAAYRALGDPRGATAYANTRLRRHPLHPVPTPHFLRAADLWYRHWVDRIETWRGRA